MKLSPKKQQQLYDAVHQEVMTSRLRVVKLLKSIHSKPITVADINLIDDVLSDLCMKAPVAATKLFKEEEKKAAGVDPCFHKFKLIWTEAFPILGFDAMSGTKINSMIKKTKVHVGARHSGGIMSPSEVEAFFAYVVAYVKRTNHWANGKKIATFDAEFNSIVNEIVNGKPRTSNASDIRDFASNV